MNIKTGEELALNAMKKEFKVLSRAADRAKKEADEYMEVGTEIIAIHRELAEIVKQKLSSETVVKKLALLKKRSERAEKIRKKDLIKLLDKQNDTEFNRDNLGHEIQMMEFKISLRKAS